MSLLNDSYGPLIENTALSLVSGDGIGKMFVFPPGLPRNGLSNPPGGALSRTSDPHGGATDVLRWNCPFTNSYDFPYDARTDVLPSPIGSHATPTRGPKLFQSVSIPAWLGKSLSPGKYRPAGALGNTVLLVPDWKRAMSNWYTAPLRNCCGKNGSHRRP